MTERTRNSFSGLPLSGPKGVYLAPSLLAADYARLGEQLAEAESAGVEVAHLDIMDGHFVPNLAMGPGLVKSIRSATGVLFDVHLMISEPMRYVEAFADAGADHITVHVESEGDISAVLDKIHELGCSAGITLRPGTPVESLYPFLPKVELALVMTVEPGFGGQSFMESQVPKVRALRAWANAHGQLLHVEVDGGVKASNAGLLIEAGANVLVAGSSIYNKKSSVADSVAALRAC